MIAASDCASVRIVFIVFVTICCVSTMTSFAASIATDAIRSEFVFSEFTTVVMNSCAFMTSVLA